MLRRFNIRGMAEGLLVRLCMVEGVRMEAGLPRDVKSIVLCSVSGRRGVYAPYRDVSIAGEC